LLCAGVALVLAAGLALPAAAMTETELRREFLGLEGLLGFTFLPLRTVNRSIDVLLSHDETITRYAEKYNMSKALIQASLLREIMHENILDIAGDAAVQLSYLLCRIGLDGLVWQASFLFKTDSSTGLGQVMRWRAMGLINNFAAEGVYEGETYDPDDWRDCEKVWRALKYDPEFNIEMVALHHLYMARAKAGIEDPLDGTLLSPTELQAKWIFAGYNTNSLTSSHTVACYKYYLVLDRWNKGEINAAELTEFIAAIEGSDAEMPWLQPDEAQA
jgi:hypothetical protein